MVHDTITCGSSSRRVGDEVVQRGCPQRGARRLVARPVAPGAVVDEQLHRGYLIYFIPGFLWCFIIYNWKCETYILKDFHAAGWPS